MSETPEFLILRHGETEWNRAGRMQGALDSPLTPAGEAQARLQGAILRRHGVEGHDWLVSPQGRARRTAELAAHGLHAALRIDPRLAEIGMGDWAGRLRAEIAASAPHLFAPEAGPLAFYGHAPGGESLAALAARVRALVEAEPGPAVIVTHGITSRMLRCQLLGLPPERFAALDGGQGVVYRIRGKLYERLTASGAEALRAPGV